MAASDPRAGRWLYGPGPDLLLGCGLLYAALALVFAAEAEPVTSRLPAAVPALLILLVSTPHYGATLLRVYEHRDERRQYVLFSLWATLLVVAAFLLGATDSRVGSILATVYLTWSPWHYTGQNYGIGVMFLRRRGIEPTRAERRLLYGSFLSSYALVFLVMHAPRGQAPDLGVEAAGGAIRFLPLGVPEALAGPALALVLVAGIAALAGWVALLARRAPLRDLLPTLCLALTQALWFTAPFLARAAGFEAGLEPLDWSTRSEFFVWIASGHAIQYLWVTSYYARASNGWHGQPIWFAKVAAAGAAVWTLPIVAAATSRGGRLDIDAGFALLLASAVNIHHFILDGAIWKLRHARIARVLIRSQAAEASQAPPRRGARRLVWSAAFAALAIAVFVYWQQKVTYPLALERRDDRAAVAVLDRLAWFGRDSADRRRTLGRRLAAQGDLDAAARELERSAALWPRAGVYQDLELVHRRRNDLGSESRARAARLRLAPEPALAERETY
jgi:hypothetical protein